MVCDVVDDRGVDEQRDEPRGIGLQRQLHHVEHQARLGDEFFLVLDVVGGFGGDDGLGLVFPGLGAVEALFEFADGRVVLVHARLVGFRERAVEALGLVADEIEEAAALFQGFDVGRDFLGVALHEEFLEQLLRAFLRRNGRAAAGVAEGRAFIAHRQHERRIARVVADLLGGELVERDPVAEAAALGMRGAGEETFLRRVRARDAGMAHAGEDRHLRAVRREAFEIRAGGVVAPRFLGKKELRQDAHVRLDGDHAARDFALRGADGRREKRRHHRVQQRQGDADAGPAEKGAARQGLVQAQIHKVLLFNSRLRECKGATSWQRMAAGSRGPRA